MTPPQIRAAIALLLTKLALLLNSRPTSMKEQAIYKAAAGNLGNHLTLDPSVPAEVGCAEAVSKVLQLAGISNGAEGIAGTAALDAWLASSGLFTRITMPEAGAIICSPTGSGNGSVEGHTGVFGLYNKQFSGDWGIMSNDSATGLFLERWSFAKWHAYYGTGGKLQMNMYKAL